MNHGHALLIHGGRGDTDERNGRRIGSAEAGEGGVRRYNLATERKESKRQLTKHETMKKKETGSKDATSTKTNPGELQMQSQIIEQITKQTT